MLSQSRPGDLALDHLVKQQEIVRLDDAVWNSQKDVVDLGLGLLKKFALGQYFGDSDFDQVNVEGLCDVIRCAQADELDRGWHGSRVVTYRSVGYDAVGSRIVGA